MNQLQTNQDPCQDATPQTLLTRCSKAFSCVLNTVICRRKDRGVEHLVSEARYYREQYQKQSAMLDEIVREFYKILEHNEYTLRIPDHYVKIIRYALWSAREANSWHLRHAPEFVDLTQPYCSLSINQVQKIKRWAERYPAYLVTLVMCLAAGGTEEDAWGIAEDI